MDKGEGNGEGPQEGRGGGQRGGRNKRSEERTREAPSTPRLKQGGAVRRNEARDARDVRDVRSIVSGGAQTPETWPRFSTPGAHKRSSEFLVFYCLFFI